MTGPFDCTAARRCLEDRAVGPLPDDEAAALDVHLAICADCRGSEGLLREVAAVLQDAPLAALTPDLERRLLSGVRVDEPPSRRRGAVALLAAAAALALGVVLLGGGGDRVGPAPPPEPSVVALAPPVDGRIDGVAAGTALHLSPDARVDEVANDIARAVFRLHEGEVVAVVGPNAPGFRFVVETPRARVVARGTIFSVAVSPEGEESYRVVEGVVDVLPLDPGRPAHALAAGWASSPGAPPGPAAREDLHEDLSRAGWGADAAAGYLRLLAQVEVVQAPAPETTPEALRSPAPEPTTTRPAQGAAGSVVPTVAGGPTVDELLRRARARQAAGDLAGAAAAHRDVVTLDPGDPAALPSHAALGRIALLQGDATEALSWFERYLRQAPSGILSEEARQGRVRALAALGRHADLSAAADDYLEHHPRGRAAAEVRTARAAALTALRGVGGEP